MKVILKGGSPEKNEQMRKFFMEEIFPILDFGIAIEPSSSVITVFEKKEGGTVDKYVDPTVEVIVELTEEARNMARSGRCCLSCIGASPATRAFNKVTKINAISILRCMRNDKQLIPTSAFAKH